MTYELGIVGGGNMAEAIVRGALKAKVLEPGAMIVSEPVEARREVFRQLNVNMTEDNAKVVAESKRVLLAVKPQTLEKLAGALKKIKAGEQAVISIMAGISIAKLAGMIGSDKARIVRVMPNTPLLVGQGMSAAARGSGATEADEEFTLKLFRSAGEAMVVDEKLMDAVTAVSGSGPAYLFYLAEAMTEAAKQLGLTDALAEQLVRQTLLGAGTLLSESSESPAALRKRVTSPGGTTQAAVEVMDAAKMQSVIVGAIARAAERSRELGG